MKYVLIGVIYLAESQSAKHEKSLLYLSQSYINYVIYGVIYRTLYYRLKPLFLHFKNKHSYKNILRCLIFGTNSEGVLLQG